MDVSLTCRPLQSAEAAADRSAGTTHCAPAISSRGLELLRALNQMFDLLGRPDTEEPGAPQPSRPASDERQP